MKTAEQYHWRHSDVFINKSEHISHNVSWTGKYLFDIQELIRSIKKEHFTVTSSLNTIHTYILRRLKINFAGFKTIGKLEQNISNERCLYMTPRKKQSFDISGMKLLNNTIFLCKPKNKIHTNHWYTIPAYISFWPSIGNSLPRSSAIFSFRLLICIKINKMLISLIIIQKKSFADALQNRCSLKFHRKAPVFVSLFLKVI